MKKKKVAVIQFPGTNCEFETARALESAGISSTIFRWNENHERLIQCDGYVLAGGFSYQDRVRAGVVASKDRLLDALKKEAKKGKPVLGICNGAQILVEAGMVPDISREKPELALAPNIMKKNGHIVRRDYYCAWVFVKVSSPKTLCAFTRCFQDNEIFPVPVAHGEGRFVTKDKAVKRAIQQKHLVAFQYCTPQGETPADFPVNPNGAMFNAAGIMNKKGNVLAFMPHPERANFLYQVPSPLPGNWSERKKALKKSALSSFFPGPGRKFFLSMKDYMEHHHVER